MKPLLLFLLLPFAAFSQTTIQYRDAFLKPTTGHARYKVVTEKRESLYHREYFYIPEGTMAMKGDYLDSATKAGHGEETWYYPDGKVKMYTQYKDSLMHGLHKKYDKEGTLVDSSFYKNNYLALRYHFGEYESIDSAYHDSKGIRQYVSRTFDGKLLTQGAYYNDSLIHGVWNYYHRENGRKKATVTYNRGKKIAQKCFDPNEVELSEMECDDKEAGPEGGIPKFQRKYTKALEKALEQIMDEHPDLVGHFQVYVEFIVEKDGSLSSFVPYTVYGYGLEERAIEVLKATSPWEPGRRRGEFIPFKMIQPVTFIIEEEEDEKKEKQKVKGQKSKVKN